MEKLKPEMIKENISLHQSKAAEGFLRKNPEQQTIKEQVRDLVSKAREAAIEGDTRSTDLCLSKLRELARKHNYNFSKEEQKELENIFKISRQNAIGVCIKKAKFNAKEGDVLMADILRNLAVRYAKEIGVKLTKEQERALNAACKEARRNGINVAIKKAQSMAKEGDVYLVEFYKDQAVKFANEIGVELTKEQEKALNAACKEARRIGINLAIKKAISFANDGNVDSADFMINTAKRYADEIGVKLTKEQEKTLNEAYRNARQNGIREYIKITLKHAIDGNEASVRFFSERVKVWAQELGRELSPREERALTQAQTILKERVVPVTMDAIRRYAKNGEVTLVDLLSNRVLENIKNLKDSDVREIREELDKLKTFVRRQAIPKLIDEVRYWAEKNEKFMVDRIVTSILEYSKEAHYSLSPEERESLITAIKKAGTVMPKELKEKN